MLCAVFSGADYLLRDGGKTSGFELSDNLRFRRLRSSCCSGEGEDTGLARYGCAGMAMQWSLGSSGLGGA